MDDVPSVLILRMMEDNRRNQAIFECLCVCLCPGSGAISMTLKTVSEAVKKRDFFDGSII